MARSWTITDLDYLHKFYASKTVPELAAQLNRSKSSIQNMAVKLNLKKLENIGRFKAGLKPWNKDKKLGPDWGSDKSRATRFKKGNIPASAKNADGAISIRRDKSGKDYKFIRISLGIWMPLHRYIYEQNFGNVPDKMIVAFKNGDTMNCHPSNLFIISRGDNMMRNGHNKNSRLKAVNKMKDLWRKEKLRKIYGLSAKTGIGRRIGNLKTI